MTLVIAEKPTGFDLKLSPVFCFAVAFSALTVYLTNTDRLLDMLPPLSRVAVVLLLAGIGKLVAPQIGFTAATRRPLVLGLAVSLGVAVWCAGADFLFRPVVNHDYLNMVSNPATLLPRIVLFSARALVQGFIYRVFGAAVLLAILCRGKRPSAALATLCIAIGWMAGILVNMAPALDYTKPLVVAYMVARFLLPGVVWGTLYRKAGLDCTEYATASVHGFFQPLVTGLLSF